MTKIRVGFIGLGQMGRHMARNLLGEDLELMVCARSAQSLEPFAQEGIQTSTSAADLAPCSFIFLCLPNDAAVRGVILGEGGLAARLGPGQMVVDCSTISHAATVEVAAALAAAGADFLDAPVSGMEARAREGTLSIMVGGSAAALDRARPLLERMGNTIVHMGDVGSGQLAKLVNQLLFDINMAGVAEILPLAAKMGLDPVKMGDIVNSGTGRSYASEFFIPRILENKFSDGYPMGHAYKDLVSGAMVSACNTVPLPVTMASMSTYQMALCQGLAGEDKGAMIKVFEALLGVSCRK